MLRLEQVSLAASIGLQYLLEDISFSVARGDRVSLIGASGAGKTSLLRLLNRLSEPTTGMIYLENQDYRQIPVQTLRKQVVLLLQEPKLLGMTVAEALAYPLILQQRPHSEIQEQVEYWRQRMHIPEDWLDRTELQLSVGQRQLVAIARAMVMQPKVLLLDEPTSALDTGRADYLLQVLTQLAAEGTTILMANHQLELAQQFSDRVFYLQNGHLLQDIAASQLDWKGLREELIQTEVQAAQEWGNAQ